jgi:hypothetical protein
MSRLAPILIALTLPAPLLAAPAGTNLSFENGLTGWTSSNVSVEAGLSNDGSHRLDLQNGFVEQTLTGLTPGQPHSLTIAYLCQSGLSWRLSHARVLLDGAAVGEFHTAQSNEYLSCNGFEFTPSTTTVTLRIESLETTYPGLLIDDIRITLGSRPSPPQESWSNLTILSGGARQLVNGGFESSIGTPDTDPNNSGPVGNEHLCGSSLPGWLVTRENVDLIQFNNARPPEGTNGLDTNGHGPGGIAQTISGLIPGGAYTLSFQHARHTSWGTQDMTGEVFINGSLARSLVRTIDQTWNVGYELVEIPAIASQTGTLTIEIVSTITDLGGSIIYDDFRISEGADLFSAWASSFGVNPSLTANEDEDPLSNGFEFILGLNPKSFDAPIPPTPVNGDQILQIPLAGAALSQGFQLDLMTSRDMNTWLPASHVESGVTLLSDTSSKGIDGLRRYLISPEEARLFWKHQLTVP